MNIFNKVTLQSMKKNRARTVVTVVGVALSAAMITAVAVFGSSLLNFLLNGSIEKYGGWHVAFLDADYAFSQERARDNEAVNAVAYENMGYAMLEGGESPEKPYLFFAGFSGETFDALPINLISGRLPENSGEVLVPAHIAAKGGVRYQVGDTLSLVVGNRMDGNKNLGQHDPYLPGQESGGESEVLVSMGEKTYTVVGICARPAFEAHSAPGYTLITKENRGNQEGRFSVFVTLKNPRGVKGYARGVAESQSYMFNDNVLRFLGVSENKLFNTLLYSVGGILVAIIMIGSIFLIYNSFSISLNERIRQFGILSSVGATAKQLRNSVLFEGLCIGATGIPLGMMAGIAGIGLVIPIVSANMGNIFYNDIPLTLEISLPALLAAAVVSLATILISAYILAAKAASMPVMACIRQTNEIKTGPKEVKTSKFAQYAGGLSGTLALKNFKRDKKRYRSIVLSLILSLVLFVSGNAFRTALVRLMEQYMVEIDYDILFFGQDLDDKDMFLLFDKLKGVDEVSQGSYQVVLPYWCNLTVNNFSQRYREYKGYEPDETVQLPVDIQFIEDGEYLKFISELGLPVEEYTGEGAKLVACAKQRVDIEDGPNELFNLFAANSLVFHVSPETNDGWQVEEGQRLDVTFADTYPVDPPPKQTSHQPEGNPAVFMVVAPYSLKQAFEVPGAKKTTGFGFYSSKPAQSVAEIEGVIQSMGITSDYTLYNVYEILEQFHSITFVVDVFTYVFVIMISLIAVANVFNTVSTNIKLRRRELAMLRSVGMSNRDFNRMMNFECAFYGLRTLLFGLPMAIAASWLIYKGMAMVERLDHFHFAFPWVSVAISVLSVFFIVFIAMSYARNKIQKENIIDALRDDMT